MLLKNFFAICGLKIRMDFYAEGVLFVPVCEKF